MPAMRRFAHSCCALLPWARRPPLLVTLLSLPARAQIGSDRYSSIVIDAATGNVLSAVNADEPRHPASLTKMMTLYMVFEALRDRRITLDQLVPVSAPCRLDEPVQARPAAGHAHHRAAGHPRPGHHVGQRRRRGAGRVAGRRRGPLRPDDDAARPRPRHDPHRVPQRLRPARPGPGHHGARPGDAGAPPGPRLPGRVPLLLHPRASAGTAAPSSTTTTCCRPTPGPTASRPAIPRPPATTWSPRRCAAMCG